MSALTNTQAVFSLQPGPNWSSFEQFRTSGAGALGSIVSGHVATLQTKTGQYRILTEQDFQKLYGLARDVERLRGGLNCVFDAVRVVQKHGDQESLNLLVSTVSMVGNIPVLPTRSDFGPLMPEGFELYPDDEVELDPAKIVRPLG